MPKDKPKQRKKIGQQRYPVIDGWIRLYAGDARPCDMKDCATRQPARWQSNIYLDVGYWQSLSKEEIGEDRVRESLWQHTAQQQAKALPQLYGIVPLCPECMQQRLFENGNAPKYRDEVARYVEDGPSDRAWVSFRWSNDLDTPLVAWCEARTIQGLVREIPTRRPLYVSSE